MGQMVEDGSAGDLLFFMRLRNFHLWRVSGLETFPRLDPEERGESGTNPASCRPREKRVGRLENDFLELFPWPEHKLLVSFFRYEFHRASTLECSGLLAAPGHILARSLPAKPGHFHSGARADYRWFDPVA